MCTICETGKVTFWESLTGEQHEIKPNTTDNTYHYREIWSLFRHNEYYINIQLNSNIIITNYSIKNSKYWKLFSLTNETIEILTHSGSKLKLEDSGRLNDCYNIEINLEIQLKEWIKLQRNNKGLQTHYDELLNIILHPTLSSYELDRATGVLCVLRIVFL